MASQYDNLPKTPNLRLNRPTYDNNADIEALNENFDILDEEVAANKANRIVSITATANEAEFKYTRQNGQTNTVSLVKKSKMNIIDMVYPVGSIYMSTASTSPATLFGGTWVALNQGRVLIGANSTYPAGSTGGEATHKITVNELPAHNHAVTVNAAGEHNHGGSTGNAGKHAHTRGTMNITASGFMGEHKTSDTDSSYYKFQHQATGALYYSGSGKYGSNGGIDQDDYVGYFDASKSWSGKTSEALDHSHTITKQANHTHTASSNNTGGGSNMNNMQPYLAVYMWKRTA